MRSYSAKSLASRLITWLMVMGLALGSLQSAGVSQAATGSSSVPRSSASNEWFPMTL